MGLTRGCCRTSGPLYSGLPCVSLARSTQLWKPSPACVRPIRPRYDRSTSLRRLDRSGRGAFHAAACTCAGASVLMMSLLHVSTASLGLLVLPVERIAAARIAISGNNQQDPPG